MGARTPWSLLLCSFALAAFSAVAAAQSPGSPASNALRFFEAHRALDPRAVLRELRPPQIGPDDRARALSVLPETGDLRPTRDERAKLSMIEPVLVFHHREQVVETRLVDSPQAAVVLHQRAVLLISRPALRLMSGAELQAVVAHEIGHEYFWTDFEPMRSRRHGRGHQELELKCDGIAVLTLVALGLDPGLLVEAVRKLTQFNETLGATNANQYPPVSDRQRFVNALRERTGW